LYALALEARFSYGIHTFLGMNNLANFLLSIAVRALSALDLVQIAESAVKYADISMIATLVVY
jgi:hypothetical protein